MATEPTPMLATSRAKGVPILMYHALFSRPAELSRWPRAVTRYWVSVEAFEQQMRALADRGYSAIPLAALLPGSAPVETDKSVVITFDDGWRSDYCLARPVLRRFGWRSEHFVTTGWVGRPGFMSWDELRGLAEDDAGIHSHTLTHPDFDRLDKARLRSELHLSNVVLEERLRRPVEFLALPGGTGATATVAGLARSLGYKGICTSRPGLNWPGADPFSLQRIPVVRSTSIEDLEAWVQGRGLDALAARRTAFRLAQRCIGTTAYAWVREQLLR